MTASITYTGLLHTTAVHTQSGTTIATDAPTDNNGLGQAFSPTDLVATALGSCMLTVMGIKARQMNIAIEETKVEINKIMANDPRRIQEIQVTLQFPNNVYSDKDKQILEHTAMTCPVFLSLHPDVKKTVNFIW